MKPWSMDVKQNTCDACLGVFAVVGLHVGLHVGLLARVFVRWFVLVVDSPCNVCLFCLFVCLFVRLLV